MVGGLVVEVLVVEDSSFARMAVTKVVGGLLPNAEFFEAADGKTGLASVSEYIPGKHHARGSELQGNLLHLYGYSGSREKWAQRMIP